MSGKRKRKVKRKRKKKEKRATGGVPLVEISLSLRSYLDLLFFRIENIGATSTSARRAARDDLAVHLSETIDRLCNLTFQKKNTVAARWAAQTLSAFVCRCINPLIVAASSVKQDRIGKRWAGESLARVHVAVEKHTKTLSRVNSAYRKTRTKIRKLRRDIVAPGLIGQIVQEELAIGERYRNELLFYRRLLGKNRKSFRTQIVKPKQVEMYYKIPREYRRTLKLAAFSVRSEGDWFREWIWPRIKKRQAELLPKLQQDAKLRDKARTGFLYLTDFQNQCRNHLRALAKLRRVR
jgi:hypothetical protein